MRAASKRSILAAFGLVATQVQAAPGALGRSSAAPSAARDASGEAASLPAQVPATRSERSALPKYFTVEMATDGALTADGDLLSTREQLASAARRAASHGGFAAAVVFAEGQPSSGEVEVLLKLLRASGFGSVMHAGQSAPAHWSALARLRRERAELGRRRLVAAGVIEGEAPAPPARGLGVELQTAGLHVAGPANQAAQRRRWISVIERHFGTFRRCHARAGAHTQNASFGVDLLIPAAGGRAQVREVRTRLRGGEFRACMQRAFEAIRFDAPPTGRPEILSYSVLFKPRAR